jgi:quaternary ammonium compound-resistance protein SugE
MTSAGTTPRLPDPPWTATVSPCKKKMSWFILVIAGLFEVGWAIGLKYTEGFSRPVPSVLTLVSMVVSVVLLGVAMRTLPVGTSYAVWTGIGIVGTAILGAVLLKEGLSVGQWICVALILGGIAGLKMLSPH